MQLLECDVLILGSGIAGCSAALRAADRGASVVVANRAGDLHASNTLHAQGGIIYRGKNDSEETFVSDFQNAGRRICNPDALKQLWEDGGAMVKDILIDRIGVPFARDAGGGLHLTNEAAHSVPRILHVADYTGRAIEEHFLAALKQLPNITFLASTTAVDLLTFAHHSKNRLDIYRKPACFGAYLFNQESQQVTAVKARETILATGGLGELYLHTTNPHGSRGDGYAMAYRAGARLMHMEYVQFHPTSLYLPHGDRFLISEAVRGEGGKLINAAGKSFMSRYHPLGDLAPRDVVAQSILAEMLKTGSECVFLDITGKDAEWIRGRFPHINQQCLAAGIDMTREPIPVVPAAHYACGGIAVDLSGRTNIERLWAVGEVSCTGVHGANRLASSSLLEGLVWGTKAGDAATAHCREDSFQFPEIDPWKNETEEADLDLIRQDWSTIRQTMWNYVGLIRTPKRLERARNILSELQREVDLFYGRSRLSDDLLGLRHGIQTAQLVLYAARLNRELDSFGLAAEEGPS